MFTLEPNPDGQCTLSDSQSLPSIVTAVKKAKTPCKSTIKKRKEKKKEAFFPTYC